MPRTCRMLALYALLLLLAGCAALNDHALNQRFGRADPARFDAMAAPEQHALYYRDVKAVLDSRCVVCHACFDAPCQLKLGSYEGITRGGTPLLVYDSTRLTAQAPTRLFEDA